MNWILKNLMGPILTMIIGIGAISVVVSKSKVLVKEVNELLSTVLEALADNKLSNKELASIVKESKDIGTAIKTIGKK